MKKRLSPPAVRRPLFLHVGALLAGLSSVHAAELLKADNADALNLTTSWANGTVPGAADIAVWDATVAAANTTLLGGNLTIGGIKLLNPGGPVVIDAGNVLTLAGGIDLSAATQDLTINAGVTIGPDAAQVWTVPEGRTLTLAAQPNKPHQPNGTNTGSVRFGTTGTIQFSSGATVPLILDAANNPWATFGLNDWAALDAGRVVAATYTEAATALTAGAVNDITGDFNINATIDVAALRFNDPTPRTVNISTSGTSRTLTARGVLVTANSGGGTIGGNAASSFMRPSRTSTAGAAFHIVQNSAADFTIAVNIPNGSSGAPVRVAKSGPGNVNLAAATGYTGGTVVNEGTLTVRSTGTLSTGAVTVNKGKLILESGGSANPPALTVNDGGAFGARVTSPGGQVSGGPALTFAAGANRLEFGFNNGVVPSATVPALAVSNLVVNGTTTVDVLAGGLVAGQFPLLKYAGTFTGTGSLVLGTLPPRVVATLSNNLANASIDLVVTTVNQPLRWATGSGVWDLATSANWKDPLGAATTYQQIGALGDSVVFEDTQSGGSPVAVTINGALTPASTLINGAKDFSFSGTGSIAGFGGLTKEGLGTLTLGTANSFSGGVNLYGGTTVFSGLPNLGASSSALTFDRGTLRYAPGNTADISSRVVTFATSGATIDTGGNDVTFAAPVGNNGSGGLQKTGAGTLTLSGANRYSGNTHVSQGVLALAFEASISNSVTIGASPGATLDVTASGLTLNGAIGQRLGQSGTINGAVVAPVGSMILPGASGATAPLTLATDATLDGGILQMDVGTTMSDLLIVAGTLNLNSGTIQLNALDALTNGTYRLIQYGTLNGSVVNLQLAGFAQAGKVAELSAATPGRIDLVVSTASSANLVWKGDGSVNPWDFATANWLNGANPAPFANGDSVTFDATGSIAPPVDIGATVLPGSVTVNSTTDYTFAGAGKISGTASLTKSGSGRLTLLNANDYSGGTTVSAGTLQVGDGSVTGDIGSGPVVNNGAILFNQPDSRTVAGAISGSGSIEHQGVGTLTFAADNSYGGATTISGGGTLQFGTGGTAGSLGSAPVAITAGTLAINRSGAFTLDNGLSGPGNLSLLGPATVTLAGANTYGGNTTVADGRLVLDVANAIPDGGATTGGLVMNNGATSAAVLDLNGRDEAINSLAGAAGAVAARIVNDAGTTTNLLTIGDEASTTVFNGVIADNSGSGSGKIALVKRGAGSLTLNGANTFSGGVIVAGGTFGIGNNTAAGSAPSITLSNGATLSLTANTPSVFPAYTVITPAGASVSLGSANLANGFAGQFVSGDATATNVAVGPLSFSTGNTRQFEGFTGTVRVEATGQIRWSAGTGLDNGGEQTTFEIVSGGSIFLRNTGTMRLGALTGDGTIGGLSAADGTGTVIVGAKGIDTEFSGFIEGVAPRANNFTKVGPGRLTLSGTLNYDGATVVSGGVLALAGSAELDDTASLTLRSNAVIDVSALAEPTLQIGAIKAQTFTASGTVRGSLNVASTATLSPGDGIGVLVVTNVASIDGPVFMGFNRTNAPVNSDRVEAASFVIGTSASLTVTNAGPELTGGEAFQLFNRPVTFATVTLPELPSPLAWVNNLAVDGSLRVSGSLVDTEPTPITGGIVDGNFEITWPPVHTGWRLETQANPLSIGLSNNWETVSGSAQTNRVVLPLAVTNAAIFYRLVYP